MPIKHHADITNQQPTFQGHANPFVIQRHQPEFSEFLQLVEFSCKVAAEGDRVSLLQRAYRQFEITHQHLNDEAPQQIIHGQLEAAHNRQLAFIQMLVIRIQRFDILAVAGADGTNGRDPERHEVQIGLRGVALKIAMQPALLLRYRQIISRLGEMVHTDVDVTSLIQSPYAQRQHVELDVGCRHVCFVDAALWLEQMRQVRVVVNRDAVRIGSDYFFQRLRHRKDGLLRQAINEINTDGAKLRSACCCNNIQCLVFRLDTVDRFLYVDIEILHAKADAVEALRAQSAHTLGGDGARVNFNRVFAGFVGRKLKPAVQMLHQVVHLRIRQIGRRAAAEMQLFNVIEASK